LIIFVVYLFRFRTHPEHPDLAQKILRIAQEQPNDGNYSTGLASSLQGEDNRLPADLPSEKSTFAKRQDIDPGDHGERYDLNETQRTVI